MDPTAGRILIDGQDLKELKLTFRQRISLCPQSHYFFNDTIIQNTRMSNPDKYFMEVTALSDKETNEMFTRYVPTHDYVEPEIVRLFKHFDLYDKVLDLPGNFEYVIGENGCLLSGGERQRLNIIRTFLKEADIYIFDEPTNFLDAPHFSKFVDMVREYVDNGKTVLVITHELGVAERLDKILCFDEKGNYEFGTHQELMKADGNYADIYLIDQWA